MNTRLIRRLLLRFRQVDNRRRALLAGSRRFSARGAACFDLHSVSAPGAAARHVSCRRPTRAPRRPTTAPRTDQAPARRGYRLGGDPRRALCAVQGGVPAAGHGGASDAQAPRRAKRHAFRRRQRNGQTARRPCLARCRRRRSDRLSGGGEFRRDRMFCVRYQP